MTGLRKLLTGVIRLYQFCLAPALPSGCRFAPTCSHYALGAIERHGIGRGLWLSVKRILKCHPYHPGGWDPVP